MRGQTTPRHGFERWPTLRFLTRPTFGAGATRCGAVSAGPWTAFAAEVEALPSHVEPQVDPDRVLVDEVNAGNRDAFEVLVRRYQHRLVNYVQAIVRDFGEAEDVAQETFVRAYRSLSRFRGDSAFKTWLYTIATNMARTSLERRGRRARVGDQSLDDDAQAMTAAQVPSGAPDVEATLVTRDAIDRALAALSEELRVAVVLRDVEGLEYKEIAEIVGVPMGTVESRIFRGRRKLRTLLHPLVSGRPSEQVTR
jgi:RNA polymerase sigma-70 factor (ECF subfamily)